MKRRSYRAGNATRSVQPAAGGSEGGEVVPIIPPPP